MVKLFVNHASTVLLLVVAAVVFGLISYVALPRESAPDVKIPYIMVTTPYIGVSPSDVESLVTIPIENELAGVKDLKKMTSTSAEGASMIALEFEPEAVIEEALQRVRDRVDRARLPEDAEDPDVREVSFSDFPIMIVTIAGPVDEEELKSLAEGLQDDVDRIPGVLDTTVSGGLTRQIRVQLDPRRLAFYGLSFTDVSGALANENVNVPGGEVTAGGSSFLLRVPGEVTTAAQLEGVAVKRVGDRPVFVRDLGRVVDSWKDRESYARMNGEQAVSLSITKRTGANIIDIGDEVKRLAAERAGTWPEGVSHRILSDQSEHIRDMVSDLENNIITALVLVVGVIVFFMGLRNSLFIGLAIPLSMLVSFAVIEALGMTLNMIVLFSLILALGMLVDNGIVIVENIYRHMETGLDIRQASIMGTREVAIPVLTSTLTTVVAFLPLVFWTGILGQFMGYLPKVVIIVLTASLVIAIVVLPVLTSRLLAKTDAPPRDVVDTNNPFMRRYRALLEWSIRHRYLSAGAGVASLVGTLAVYAVFNHGTEFFPATDPDRATVSIRAPDGTDLEATDAIVRRVEAVLAREENVDVYVAETGRGGGRSLLGNAAQANLGRITIDFLPHRNKVKDGGRARVEGTQATIDRIRAAVQVIPGAEIDVEKERMGPPVGAPVAVEVSGLDFHEVGALAARVRRVLGGVPGVTDVADDYRVGRPEMRLRVDRGAAKRVGASTVAVANAVRTAVAGTKASALRDGKDEYDIVVELDPRFRDNLQDVLALRIPGRLDTKPDTYMVPLSAVASYELAGGSGSIRHVDQELVVTVQGDVALGFNENLVRASVDEELKRMRAEGLVPPGMELRLGGADDEQRRAKAFLGRAFLWAIALISMVLVTQFNGFRLPFIIMTTVVLSLVGVLWGLLLTGTSFGVIMTGIGVISLAGVVVNNAIVLLDYVELLRSRGEDVHAALVRAGMTRFRPVMLTAGTTVLGLIPMGVGVSVDFREMKLLVGGSSAQWWGPMAVAVIFGLTFATLLTLVLVPTLYNILEDMRGLWARVRRRVRPAAVLAGMLLLVGHPARAGTVTLEQALAAAERHDVDVAAATERRIQAETLQGQAWSLLSPKVSGQASYTVNQREIAVDFSEAFDLTSSMPWMDDILAGALDAGWVDPASLESQSKDGEPIVIQEKTAWAGSVSVVQPLFNAQSVALVRGALRTVDAARMDEGSTRQHLRAGATAGFYALAVSREGLALARRALDTARANLDLAQRQVAAGSVSTRAELQARLAVAQAERDLLGAQQQVVVAAEAFHRLTGLDRESEPVLPEPMQAPESVGGALDQAFTHRSDLRAAEHRTRAAELGLAAQRLGWLPSVDGRFTWSYTENTGFSGESTNWAAVFVANWSLWDGGLRLAQTRQEASEARLAALAERGQRRAAEEEVHTSWERLGHAERALVAARTEVELAERNLEQATRELQAGSVTWLEVDTARLLVERARLAVLSERMNRDLAVVDLRVACGTY